MRNPHDIIRRPVITENTSEWMAELKYVFEVDVRANKTEIKRAVEQIFDVKVEKVNTMRTARKPKTQGRHSGYTSVRKKAIVQLSEDSKPLEFFESV